MGRQPAGQQRAKQSKTACPYGDPNPTVPLRVEGVRHPPPPSGAQFWVHVPRMWAREDISSARSLITLWGFGSV